MASGLGSCLGFWYTAFHVRIHREKGTTRLILLGVVPRGVLVVVWCDAYYTLLSRCLDERPLA